MNQTKVSATSLVRLHHTQKVHLNSFESKGYFPTVRVLCVPLRNTFTVWMQLDSHSMHHKGHWTPWGSGCRGRETSGRWHTGRLGTWGTLHGHGVEGHL